MSDTSSPGLKNWITLAILGVIWGASFMAVAIALEGVGPITVAAFRLVIGAAALCSIAALLGHGLPPSRDRRVWLHVIGMAVFTNALPFSLLGWGQQFVPSAFAGVSMAVVPLVVLPLAHIFVPGERMSVPRTVGFSLGFLGVLTLIGWDNILGNGGDSLPKLACIGATMCYAIGSIITRRCPSVHPISFSAAGLLLGALIAVPVALWAEGVPQDIDLRPALALIYLGLGPTAVATILLVRVIQSAGPSFMSLVNYQVPIWSIIFGVTLMGETLPAQFITALALILIGLGISQKRQKRLSRYPA